MKRSATLAGLMVLAAASSAAAQGRPGIIGQIRSTAQASAASRAAATSTPTSTVTNNACPAGSYSVVQSPDGTSVSVLFHSFSAETDGTAPGSVRSTCRIQVPLAVQAGYALGLTSVDYRGYAFLGQRQSAELAVDYEVGRGNRAPRFQRRLQGAAEGDFAFTDRLPPGRLRQTTCGTRGVPLPVLAIDATLTLNSPTAGEQAMVSLDSADQTASGALNYRFEARPCTRRSRPTTVNELSSD